MNQWHAMPDANYMGLNIHEISLKSRIENEMKWNDTRNKCTMLKMLRANTNYPTN